MVEVLEFKGNKVFGLYHTGICKECWAVKMTFRELLNALPSRRLEKQYLVQFYALTQLLTPDHPGLDNIEWYFVFDECKSCPDHVSVYIVFRHFEHCHIDDFIRVRALADMLMIVFDTEEIYVQEFSCNEEHLILKVLVSETPNFIANILKPLLITSFKGDQDAYESHNIQGGRGTYRKASADF